MSLSLYKKKRSFNQTPEPKGEKKSSGKELHFVIQKHAASHMHYDFRLEMEGVLKSWAVPKGPSLNPSVKRLAMMVEDHPFDYRTFEGIIPPGNYGAGTVIVWDEGTYDAEETGGAPKTQHEKILLHQLHAGRLKFFLHGKKLKGSFALVKISSRGENAWLLIKHRDEYATEEEITKKDKSVKSNLTLEQVAKSSKNTWKSNRAASTKTKKKTASAKEKIASDDTQETTENADITALLEKAKKAPFPKDTKPMLATLTDKPFDNENWIYEIKWDGYRAVSYIKDGKVEIRSRTNLSYNEQFREIREALQEWHLNAVVDGEIVALNEEGRADFQRLQNYQKMRANTAIVYYVFDIIWYDGKSVTELPLIERKTILKNILPDNELIKYSDHIEGHGKEFFDVAIQTGLEGIMAKKADSEYLIGYRTKSWLKIKNNRQTEAIICGFTAPRKSRKYFGAVILGKYEGDELVYIGHSGSGFDDKGLKDIYEKFKPLITDTCPFKKKPKTNMPVTWLKPKLVCEVKFSEWTEEKILRIPIFLGLREDKTAEDEKEEEVVAAPSGTKKSLPKKETTEEAEELVEKETTYQKVSANKKAGTKNAISKKTSAKNKKAANDILLPEDSKEKIITINERELKFTNLDKIYWPKEKITKRDLLNYYHQITPYILPYMKDRPQSLNRHPNGINAPSFYQKNVEGKVADWITTHPYTSESDGETKEFLVCADEATLMYIANLGCIEMNPWHSRYQSPDNPDWCVIDLDPDDNPFEEVIEAAQAVKHVLDEIEVPGYCKTSGSSGMHIYIPLGAQYSYDQSRMLAELIVRMVFHEISSFTSLERNPSKRKGKIYLDYLQNRSIQTIAAPYSVRPKPGATVSTPLHWEEVKKGLSPKDFTMFNILERLKDEGDIFTPVLGEGIDLEKTLEKMNRLFDK